MKREQLNRGFTLVELMIVVVILGVLAAIAIPQYLGYIEQSKIRSAESVLNQFPVLLEQARADYGSMCPDDCGSCAALNSNSAIRTCFPDFRPALQDSDSGAYEYYLHISTGASGEVADYGAQSLIDLNFPAVSKITPGQYK